VEKLSGILPNSPRVKSVDLSEAKPRRPGAPSFGVPQGTTSGQDRVTISSSAGVDEAAKDLLTYRNPKDARGAKIAENISRKFFETRLLKPEIAAPKPTTEAPVELPELPATEVVAPRQSDVMASYSPEKIEMFEAPLQQMAE
jgi:hypothetical protein